MKKLLFLIPILVSFLAEAQHPGYVRRATKDQVIASAADSTSHIPSGATPSLRGGWSGAGAQFFNTSDSGVYYWTGFQWLRSSQELFNHIVSGFDVSWNNGLVYDVAPGVAYVNGKRVTYAGGQVTLTTADPSNPRIDIIVVQDDGTVIVVTGTASANPVKPQADTNQLELSFATLDAGATQPNDVGSTVLWDGEGADLLTGATTGTAAFNNTTQAFHGTHSTFVSTGGLAGAQVVTYKAATVYNYGSYNHIKLYVRLGTALAGVRSPDISLLNGNTVVTNTRILRDFGLNPNLINAWQTIIVPLSAFNYSNSNFTGIRIGRYNATVGNFWIDYIQLESAPIINVSGAYLPLSFPSDQLVQANSHSLTFEDLNFLLVREKNLRNQLYVSDNQASLQTNDNDGVNDFIAHIGTASTSGYVRSELYGQNSTTSDKSGIVATSDSLRLESSTGVYKLTQPVDGSAFTKMLTWDPTTNEIGIADVSGGGGGAGWPLTGSAEFAGDVSINQANTNGYNFSLSSDDGTNSGFLNVSKSANNTKIGWNANDASEGGFIRFGTDISVTIDGTGTLKYAADYSANYTSRSLVDKDYVDNAVSGGGGGGTPAGSNTEVQYNNSGAFGSTANFTYDGTAIILKRNSGGGYLSIQNTNSSDFSINTLNFFSAYSGLSNTSDQLGGIGYEPYGTGALFSFNVSDGSSSGSNRWLYNGTDASTTIPGQLNFGANANIHTSGSGGSTELVAHDGAGNNTTISPHNFSGIPQGASNPMAWAYYSEREGKYINVDMYKLAELVEKLTGEKLIYTGDINHKPNETNK